MAYYQAVSNKKGVCGHKHKTKEAAVACGKKMKDCSGIKLVTKFGNKYSW